MFFFFNDTATTEIYTLSLHDALPICLRREAPWPPGPAPWNEVRTVVPSRRPSTIRRASRCRQHTTDRSEEHTSELQSRSDLVCRLLLEKKKGEGRPPYK